MRGVDSMRNRVGSYPLSALATLTTSPIQVVSAKRKAVNDNQTLAVLVM